MRTRNNPITLPDGRAFPSLRECARACGISQETLYYRRKKGLFPFSAQQPCNVKLEQRKPVMYRGKYFPSMREAARHFNVTVSAVSNWAARHANDGKDD